MRGNFSSEIERLVRDAWDSVGDAYQQVVLGYQRFPQHPHAPEPESGGPSSGGQVHHIEFSPPADMGGENLPPDPSGPQPPDTPYDPLAGLKALRMERGDAAGEPKMLQGREPDRGMDFDR